MKVSTENHYKDIQDHNGVGISDSNDFCRRCRFDSGEVGFFFSNLIFNFMGDYTAMVILVTPVIYVIFFLPLKWWAKEKKDNSKKPQ